MKMTTEEAFVKVLQMHGIEDAFGIIGSAMMPISDLFPVAGIKFWDCAHEYTAGMMADGYATAFKAMGIEKVKAFLENHKELKVFLIFENDKNEFETLGLNGFPEF